MIFSLSQKCITEHSHKLLWMKGDGRKQARQEKTKMCLCIYCRGKKKKYGLKNHLGQVCYYSWEVCGREKVQLKGRRESKHREDRDWVKVREKMKGVFFYPSIDPGAGLIAVTWWDRSPPPGPQRKVWLLTCLRMCAWEYNQRKLDESTAEINVLRPKGTFSVSSSDSLHSIRNLQNAIMHVCVEIQSPRSLYI